VTGKTKDEFASHGLRAIHSTEKCHICLRKKNIVRLFCPNPNAKYQKLFVEM
jgi:hypothetical protein